MPGVGAAKKQEQFVSTNKAYVPARAMTDVVDTARLCQYWHEDTLARASVRAHTCTMHQVQHSGMPFLINSLNLSPACPRCGAT